MITDQVRPQRAATKRARGGRLRRFLRRRWWLFALSAFAVLVGLGVGVGYAIAKVPLPAQVPAAQVTYVYDRYGHQIGTLAASQNRRVVPLTLIGPWTRYAVLAAEDRTFYQHGALSVRGLLRAGYEDVRHLSFVQGGSTIAQQYVKNAFVGDDRSLVRKLREAVIAIKLEHRYTKDQILGFYLNTIYFGRGAYGIDAAARAYFDIPAYRLDLAQSAFLAGAIRSPTYYADPADHQSALERRAEVLQTMLAEHWITQAQYAAANRAPLVFTTHPPEIGVASSPYPYFMAEVQQYLISRFGEDVVNRGGLRVYTTLDPTLQREATTAVQTVLPHPKVDPVAGMVALDPRTGAVLAMYGGRDYAKSQFNLAVDAQRQAGSTMKPFVLAKALEAGMTLSSTFPAPASIDLHGHVFSNAEPSSFGVANLAEATAYSINTVFVQLIDQPGVGPPAVARLAAAAGIEDRLTGNPAEVGNTSEVGAQGDLSLALGSNDVSALNLASGYSTFADDGVHVQPFLVWRVTDAAGQVLEQHRVAGVRVLPASVAATVNTALEGVLNDPGATAYGQGIGRPAAGKTGTTNNYADARFVGYTPNLLASVWLGYPQNESTPMIDVEGFPYVYGGTLPAEIWHEFMTRATAGLPAASFATPTPPTTTAPPAPVSTLPPVTTLPPTTSPPTTVPPTTAPPTTLPPTTVPPTTAPPTTRAPATTGTGT